MNQIYFVDIILRKSGFINKTNLYGNCTVIVGHRSVDYYVKCIKTILRALCRFKWNTEFSPYDTERYHTVEILTNIVDDQNKLQKVIAAVNKIQTNRVLYVSANGLIIQTLSFGYLLIQPTFCYNWLVTIRQIPSYVYVCLQGQCFRSPNETVSRTSAELR